MTINVQIYNQSACISIPGLFDFNVASEFTDAYTQLLNNAAVNEIEIDMSEVNHIDNSALGVLLLLHYRAISANKLVVLLNVSRVASHELKTAHFDGLFGIKYTA